MTRRSRAHRCTRAAGATLQAIAVGVAVGGGGACEPFTTLQLVLQEPVDANRIGNEPAALSWQHDGEDLDEPHSVSADPGKDFNEDLAIGYEARIVSIELSLGDIARGAEPTVLGRATQLVPAVDDAPATLNVPMIVAKVNAAERLDAERPTARRAPATCADDAGRAWFLGGFPTAGGDTANGYAFTLDELQANEASLTSVRARANDCDGVGDGDFVLLEGGCNAAGIDDGTATLLRAGDAKEDDAVLPFAVGCAPSVSVAGGTDGTVWVVGDDEAEPRLVSSLGPRSADPLSLPPHGPAAALTAELLFVAGPATDAEGKTTLVALVGGDLVARDGPTLTAGVTVVDVVRRAGVVTALLSDASVADVVVQDADGSSRTATVTLDVRSVEALQGMARLRKLDVLPDRRAVVLGTLPSGGSALVIEGAELVDVGTRDDLAVTVGGAILLVGGDVEGTDVVIPP